jgi:hypothetical protein
MIAYHCDREGCDSWQKSTATTPFISVFRGLDILGHFCCIWCMTVWGSYHSEPTVTLEN